MKCTNQLAFLNLLVKVSTHYSFNHAHHAMAFHNHTIPYHCSSISNLHHLMYSFGSQRLSLTNPTQAMTIRAKPIYFSFIKEHNMCPSSHV